MSYDERKKDFVKEKFWVIEMDLDTCTLDYGTAPCSASVGVTGSQKCFNTAKTCQDRANYTKGVKTYRYCTKRSPVPAGLDAIPSLKSAPSISGATINPKGGLGVRGSISLNFLDHRSSDIGIDPYVSERTYVPYDTGTYWGKKRARNPYYNNRPIRAFSGYLVDGVYDPANFQQRSYVIENMTANRGNGSVTGKDVLKLADNDRAQYPPKSNGELSVDITAGELSFTVTPVGVGDTDYDASGWVRIADEVMSFTRVGDVFAVVRAQYTTPDEEHSAGDTVQQCKYLNDTVANIDYELLTVGASIDPAFIDLPTWTNESNDNYPYLLETLLTEPIGVQQLLKELGDNAPHFLYFDERTQLINFKAVKAPPVNVNYINNDEHILKDSLKVSDSPKSRLSDILVYFGQRNPTKKMDELNNYSQTYIRSDLSSSSDDEYGSKKIETIYSRWINNFNKTAALELAARKGRRMGITPRNVNFKMTAKDSDYWLGDELGIDHPVLQTETGETGNNSFQITSVTEAGDFNYTAIEYLYSDALPNDPASGVDLVIIAGNANNINLRTIFDSIYPSATAATTPKFTIDNSAKIGSTSNTAYSIETGVWPVGMAPIKLLVRGLGAGKGGNAGFQADSDDGGPCLNMDHDLTIEDVTGLLGGGGGGGAYGEDTVNNREAGGGGGGGVIAGIGQLGGQSSGDTTGGTGATISYSGGFIVAGNGGDLGENGTVATGSNLLAKLPGNAGIAINKNGHTLIIENGAANIKGAIV